MAKVLILFTHPALEKSRVNKPLLQHAKMVDNVTIHDLYEHYPDFNIDIQHEQQLLLQNDIILWHHPLYWYNSPALLKQWIDLVLEHGWAYGSQGKALVGKKITNVITSGGAADAYSKEGHNNYTIEEFLAPFIQTAKLCNMQYLEPFKVQGTHKLTQPDIEEHAIRYKNFLTQLTTN